jgi:hypothetical protein
MGGLYDKCLIGGADHVMAHAIVGHQQGRLHHCVTKSHVDEADRQDINLWSDKFHELCEGKLGFVSGDVLHLYHGDLKDRNYYHRIKDFSKHIQRITEKDPNGLFTTDDNDIIQYLQGYFKGRETQSPTATTDNDQGGAAGFYYEDGDGAANNNADQGGYYQ